MILLSLLVVLTVYLVQYHWSRRKLYAAASKIKGPTCLPLIGNAHLFLCKSEDILHRIRSVFKLVDKEPVRLWLGPYLMVGLKNPIHLEKIMTSTKFAYKHELYEFLDKFARDGLITASGLKPKYKTHRRIIQPLFDLKFVKSTFDIVWKQTNICMEKLNSHVEKDTFDIHDVIICYTMDTIAEALLGMKMDNQEKGLSKFCESIVDMLDLGYERLVKVWLHPDFIFNRLPIKKKSDEVYKETHRFIEEAIKESKKRRNSMNEEEGQFLPIIDRLTAFAENNPGLINYEDLVNHLITVMPASADTFSIISSFAAVCFGMYPEYQERAAEEIRSVIGEKPREVTLEDIYKMEYLDMCIKDVLRLFPVGPYILRRILEDYKLDKWTIPKGTAIVVPIFDLHRDPTYWASPEHFHPDHFLPEYVQKRHVYAYLPFSAGPRGCIGKTFASVLLKMFMANLLQRFEIQAEGKVPDIELYSDISIRPKRGYNCRLQKRQWYKNDIK